MTASKTMPKLRANMLWTTDLTQAEKDQLHLDNAIIGITVYPRSPHKSSFNIVDPAFMSTIKPQDTISFFTFRGFLKTPTRSDLTLSQVKASPDFSRFLERFMKQDEAFRTNALDFWR